MPNINSTHIRHQLEQERDRAIQAAHEEFAAKIVTLEQWEKIGSDGESNPIRRTLPTIKSLTATDQSAEWPGLRKAVWRAIKRIDGEFRRDDVLEKLRAMYPDQEIDERRLPAELWCLHSKTGRIIQESPGGGRVQATYKRKETPS